MGKYGKKNVVNLDPSTYIVGLLGESGIGKTTTMYKTCDKTKWNLFYKERTRAKIKEKK